ncbi:MAG: glycosyltransferase family 25 protein [Psychroserpens sp.]|uniref:glycosyltransferase family 25 protein n=1 Tax=Psychroserpens sp. TaxID=2020870 RepID=UPI003C9BD0A8
MIRLFIVNLEKDVARRTSIMKQMQDLDLPFEFFKACYGKSLTSKELSEHFDAKKAYRNFSFPLPLAHIGCSLSHLMLYKKMVDEDIDTACIFEDDIILPQNTKEVLQSLQDKLSTSVPQVILLSPSLSYDEPVFSIRNYDIRHFKSGYFTSSYLINIKAAEAIYNTMYPVHYVADSWNYLKSHKIIDILSISPGLIEQDQQTFGSSTNQGQKDQDIKRIANSLQYKIHRAFFKPVNFISAYLDRTFRPYRSSKS